MYPILSHCSKLVAPARLAPTRQHRIQSTKTTKFLDDVLQVISEWNIIFGHCYQVLLAMEMKLMHVKRVPIYSVDADEYEYLRRRALTKWFAE